MNSPNRPARRLGFTIRHLPILNRSHVFMLALLIVAALPAAFITCAIWLPIRLFQWLRGKPSAARPCAPHEAKPDTEPSSFRGITT